MVKGLERGLERTAATTTNASIRYPTTTTTIDEIRYHGLPLPRTGRQPPSIRTRTRTGRPGVPQKATLSGQDKLSPPTRRHNAKRCRSHRAPNSFAIWVYDMFFSLCAITCDVKMCPGLRFYLKCGGIAKAMQLVRYCLCCI